MKFLFLLGGVAVAGLIILHFYMKLEKQLKKISGNMGILHKQGECSYVSPMAIMAVDDKEVDLSKIRSELFDRVVRLRMVEIFEAVNDPAKKIKDPEEINNLKRMATVNSALGGISIHNSLVLIDHMTKALLIGIEHRMELINMSMDEIPPVIETPATRATLRFVSGLDYSVKQEFMTMLGKDDYDYFHIFATRVRHRLRRQRFENYSDAMIKSAITAYAARMGFWIPRSYVLIDETTSILTHWDATRREVANANVIQMHGVGDKLKQIKEKTQEQHGN